MELIKQQTRGQCLITAHAMCMDMPVQTVIAEIGHDGMEKVHPDLEEPFCYRGHHEQEITDHAFKHRFALIHIDALPGALSGNTGDKPDELYIVQFAQSHDDRLMWYLNSTDRAIILGKTTTTNVWHAVAWDGKSIFDPVGKVYSLDQAEENRFGSVLGVLIYKHFGPKGLRL